MGLFLQIMICISSLVGAYLVWRKEWGKGELSGLSKLERKKIAKARRRQKRKQKPPLLKYVVLSIMLLPPLAICASWVIDYFKGEEEQMKSTTAGIISPHEIEGEPEDNRIITVLIGGNSMSTDLESLRRGYILRPLSVGGEEPFRIRVENEKLLVTATFTSLDGKIAASMVDNEWQVNPGNHFDRNFDDHGLEVIDSYGVRFQIEFLNASIVKLNGVCRYGSSMVFFDDRAMKLMNKWTPDDVKNLNRLLPALFQFPSRLHINQRATEN